MTFKLDTSAGEFFELIRPSVLVLSAVVSIWVLASARRHRFRIYTSIAWALGTLFFPLVTFPLYLVARFLHHQRGQSDQESTADRTSSSLPRTHGRIVIPLAYAAIVLSLIGIHLYRDHQDVDTHLALAIQSKLNGKPGVTIDEYRAALKLDDDPHTHKLLRIELADTVDLTGALFEFRTAEQGGEIDDLIAFRIATLLDSLSLPNQATLEYQRFLESRACLQALPEEHCAGATLRVQTAQTESQFR